MSRSVRGICLINYYGVSCLHLYVFSFFFYWCDNWNVFTISYGPPIMLAILDAVCLFSILKLGHTLSLHISTNNFYFWCQNFAVVSTLLNFVRIFRKAHDENCKQAELEKKKALKEAEAEKSKEANIAKNVSRWHLVCLPLHDLSPCAWDTCCFGQQPSICADNLRNCFRICTTLVRGNWIAPHLQGNKVVRIAHSTLLCTFIKDSTIIWQNK